MTPLNLCRPGLWRAVAGMVNPLLVHGHRSPQIITEWNPEASRTPCANREWSTPLHTILHSKFSILNSLFPAQRFAFQPQHIAGTEAFEGGVHGGVVA